MKEWGGKRYNTDFEPIDAMGNILGGKDMAASEGWTNENEPWRNTPGWHGQPLSAEQEAGIQQTNPQGYAERIAWRTGNPKQAYGPSGNTAGPISSLPSQAAPSEPSRAPSGDLNGIEPWLMPSASNSGSAPMLFPQTDARSNLDDLLNQVVPFASPISRETRRRPVPIEAREEPTYADDPLSRLWALLDNGASPAPYR